MESDKLEFFKNVLNDELITLLGEAGKTVTEMTSDASNFPDPTDRATQESDRSFELRIAEAEKLGFKRCIIPTGSLKRIKKRGIRLEGVTTVQEAMNLIFES